VTRPPSGDILFAGMARVAALYFQETRSHPPTEFVQVIDFVSLI